jgi:hypothetical protein
MAKGPCHHVPWFMGAMVRCDPWTIRRFPRNNQSALRGRHDKKLPAAPVGFVEAFMQEMMDPISRILAIDLRTR